MIEVTSAARVVFPEVGLTKGEVVAYYARMAPRLLVHVAERPLSIRRFPQGLARPGFFQKNVPPHYPASIGRLPVPRGEGGVTTYPLLREPDHLAYLANQGAIELHVATARASDLGHPDRLVIDLDPPAGGLAAVRDAARWTRDTLATLGLPTAPVATGSKGYHVVAPIRPTVAAPALELAAQKLAALLAAAHPDGLTTAFRIAQRGPRVFLDWLRNRSGATVVAPWSLRATARATVAVPLAWDEVETIPPDGFSLVDVDRLADRPDPLADLAAAPADAAAAVAAIDATFERAGLVLEPFDRFRS